MAETSKRQRGHLTTVPVLAPLDNITVHVKQTKSVRWKNPYGCRLLPVIALLAASVGEAATTNSRMKRRRCRKNSESTWIDGAPPMKIRNRA
jgi:hypothetical protein